MSTQDFEISIGVAEDLEPVLSFASKATDYFLNLYNLNQISRDEYIAYLWRLRDLQRRAASLKFDYTYNNPINRNNIKDLVSIFKKINLRMKMYYEDFYL